MGCTALEQQLAAGQELQLRQEAALSTAQADVDKLAQEKQALQERRQTTDAELDQSLQQLDGLRQDVDQLQDVHRQKSEQSDKLESELLASQDCVQSMQARFNSHMDRLTGIFCFLFSPFLDWLGTYRTGTKSSRTIILSEPLQDAI